MSDKTPDKCCFKDCENGGPLFMPVLNYWPIGYAKEKYPPWPLRPEIAMCGPHKNREMADRDMITHFAPACEAVMKAAGCSTGPNIKTAEYTWEEPRSLTQVMKNGVEP